MGFLDRPAQKSANPTSKFLEWKSNDKVFSFYDKENKENVRVDLPLKFLVLEEYHTLKGFSDSDQCGIFSNEVLFIGKEEVEVKTFKGRVIAKGLYKNVKSIVNAQGGIYHKSIYAVTDKGELINISLKGACVAAWSIFTDKSFSRLKDYEQNQFESFVSNITALTPIYKRINANDITALLDKELKERGLNSKFEFAKTTSVKMPTASAKYKESNIFSYPNCP